METFKVINETVPHEKIVAWYEAWNRRDWDAMAALLDPNFIYEGRGVRDFIASQKELADALPDGNIGVQHIAGSGANRETVVVEYKLKATIRGLPQVLYFCDLLRFHNGLLVHCRKYQARRLDFAEAGLSSRKIA